MTNIQYISSNTIETINAYLSEPNIMIITDSNVFSYYRSLIQDKPHIVIPAGEKSKSIYIVEKILDKMYENECNRDTLLVGFGGGVVCDITGYVAASYKRGIQHGFVATSIIAQADAALGGKNGVNVNNKKNLCGTFKLPKFVLCPINFLKTLPDIEKINGMAEVIKSALIGSKSLLEFLRVPPNDWKLDYKYLFHCIKQAGEIKMRIVNQDFQDRNQRRILNFGHTLGHAIESSYGLKHGHAIAIGMVHVLRLTASEGVIDKAILSLVIEILKKHGLPTTFDYDMNIVTAAISNDRKTKDGNIKYICLVRHEQQTTTPEANIPPPNDNLSELNRLIDGDDKSAGNNQSSNPSQKDINKETVEPLSNMKTTNPIKPHIDYATPYRKKNKINPNTIKTELSDLDL